MTTEDYCSYEVAKLLKEKGFNEDIETEFISIDDTHIFKKNNYSDRNSTLLLNEYSAPTHQMTMKWLREVKGLFIAINCDDLNYNWQVFDVHHRDKNGEPICQSESFGGYYNFKKATDDAIKYCLEKLIL